MRRFAFIVLLAVLVVPGAIAVEDIREYTLGARTCTTTGSTVSCADPYDLSDPNTTYGEVESGLLLIEYGCMATLTPGVGSGAELECKVVADNETIDLGRCDDLATNRGAGSGRETVNLQGACTIPFIPMDGAIGTDANGNNVEIIGTYYELRLTPLRDIRMTPETITLAPFDQWIPFAAFAALAIWGWYVRSTMLALVGTIGMLSTFVITGWSVPVLVLAGVIVIWVEYYRVYRGEGRGVGS